MDRCWRGRTFEYWFYGPASHTGRIPRGREGKRFGDQIYCILFDIREVQFQVERSTDILPDDA